MTILTFAFLLLPFALLSLSLVGNSILSSFDRVGVAEIVAFRRPHILIQLENEWNARGNIVFDNIFIRNRVVNSRGWLAFLVVCVCLAISLVYELVEWAAALTSAEASSAFLGTQGDPWDTQEDMAMAFVGAVCALFLSRWHDRQIAKVSGAVL